MKDDFDYQQVPSNYIHCFNQECPRGGNCLRRLAASHAPKDYPYIVTVNPAAYPRKADQCPHFRSSEKIRFAWGITSIFDTLPYKTALVLKRSFRNLFSKRSYYGILHQERPLSPSEQATIAQIFAKHGIATPPVYDRYTEEYDLKEAESTQKSPYISLSISIKK